MKSIALAPLFALFLPLGVTAEERVLLEQKFESQMTRTVLIAPEEFTADTIERRSASFIAEVAGRFRIARLELYPGPDDPRGPNCKCSEPVSYGFWNVLYERQAGRLPPSAEVLTIGGGSALRSRNADGLVHHRVLQAPDPYLLTIRGGELRLVHMGIENGPRWGGAASGAMLRCYFITSGRFDEALGRDAIVEIQHRTLTRNVRVVIRHDPWFIKESDFPVVPPYVPEARPPSREEYEKGSQVSCVDSVAVTACTSGGVHK